MVTQVLKPDSLADTSKPNAGRIYDYWLGGSYNSKVDREAGDRIVQLLPFVPKLARLQRRCLWMLAEVLTQERGYDVIIDFASGLPTSDHIHHHVSPGTVVIYSDWDPITVQLGRRILEDDGAQNAYYFEANAQVPEGLLNRQAVLDILKGRRDVALIFWGVSGFLRDEDVIHAARVLDEWAGPKACWAFNTQGTDIKEDDPKFARTTEIYAQMGSPVHSRTLEQFMQLLKPWRPDERGFISLIDWHGLRGRPLMNADEIDAWGQSGGAYGGYLMR